MSNTKSKPNSASKSKTKQDNKYEDMLKKIDLGLDNKKSKSLFVSHDDEDNDNSFVTQGGDKSKLSLLDLVSNLQNNEKATGNNALLRSHLTDLTQKTVLNRNEKS